MTDKFERHNNGGSPSQRERCPRPQYGAQPRGGGPAESAGRPEGSERAGGPAGPAAGGGRSGGESSRGGAGSAPPPGQEQSGAAETGGGASPASTGPLALPAPGAAATSPRRAPVGRTFCPRPTHRR
ncbi:MULTISPECIES: hypothetical protein [Parafrankia]|uniref:hypothetical protein n=1 Tax=Parafrankia TaxID=2994362 RepID=UPI00104232FD|nr:MULTISPECIES: hypothetical protein [Parafrankia]MBE3201202.1 hypothetical protein [Parafrankia sp. CH37]